MNQRHKFLLSNYIASIKGNKVYKPTNIIFDQRLTYIIYLIYTNFNILFLQDNLVSKSIYFI